MDQLPRLAWFRERERERERERVRERERERERDRQTDRQRADFFRYRLLVTLTLPARSLKCIVISSPEPKAHR